jgi:L-alanine-DL-glutamate epimerase-like enolase superfamily enzyme
MKVSDIEFIHLDVPFDAHTDTQMKYWLPHWRISQLCKVTLENGVVGWGETIPNYTWSKVPDGVEDRVWAKRRRRCSGTMNWGRACRWRSLTP